MVWKVLDYAHFVVSQHAGAGDILVDATVGNGHDTVYLASLAGDGGRVFGFDISPVAIERTGRRLNAEGLSEVVTLHQAPHATMRQYVSGPAMAVMFNLGYLPGSGKSTPTVLETTLPALESACALIAEDGVITVVVYRGHREGQLEAEGVANWISDLPPGNWNAMRYGWANRPNNPPELFVLTRNLQRRNIAGPQAAKPTDLRNESAR